MHPQGGLPGPVELLADFGRGDLGRLPDLPAAVPSTYGPRCLSRSVSCANACASSSISATSLRGMVTNQFALPARRTAPRRSAGPLPASSGAIRACARPAPAPAGSPAWPPGRPCRRPCPPLRPRARRANTRASGSPHRTAARRPRRARAPCGRSDSAEGEGARRRVLHGCKIHSSELASGPARGSSGLDCVRACVYRPRCPRPGCRRDTRPFCRPVDIAECLIYRTSPGT